MVQERIRAFLAAPSNINVLDLGVPSDATVTNAKTNFTSTSSAAGLQIKGDGTTDGTLQLNCSQNSHFPAVLLLFHCKSLQYTCNREMAYVSVMVVVQFRQILVNAKVISFFEPKKSSFDCIISNVHKGPLIPEESSFYEAK